MATSTDSSKQNCAATRSATISGCPLLRVWAIAAAIAGGLQCLSGEAVAEEGDRTVHDPGLSWQVAVDPLAIIDQQSDAKLGMRACGPASVMNSLRFAGTPESEIYGALLGDNDTTKMRFLIDRWFAGRASQVANATKRFGPHGCFVEDLTAGYNELLAEHRLPPLTGAFLDRGKSDPKGQIEIEEDLAYVRRVHRVLSNSLREGLPPIISLRSFVARKDEDEAQGAPGGGDIRWEVARIHFVVVSSVARKLAENDLGFRFEYIDPNGGKTGSGWVYAERHLPFRAFRGSNGVGEWLRGTPFLLVIAPGIESLQPLQVDWPDRVIVTLDYALYRD